MIRRATIDDLEPLIELMHEFDPGTDPAGVVPLLADDRHGVIWVTDALDAYAVVAWGWSVEIGGAEAVLDELYVRHRGQGTGAAMVDHVNADCTARGVRRIFLETEADNEAARRLYARHGYLVESSVWMARVNSL